MNPELGRTVDGMSEPDSREEGWDIVEHDCASEHNPMDCEDWNDSDYDVDAEIKDNPVDDEWDSCGPDS